MWHTQIERLTDKLKTRLVGLAKLKFVLPFETKKKVTLGIINSVLIYCLPLFGGCDKGQIRELQVLQNKAAQIVSHKPPRSHRIEMYENLKWMTVHQLVVYHTLLMVYKIRTSSEPEYLASILKKENRNENIIVPNTKLELARKSFGFRGPTDWNSLPSCVRRCSKIGEFKNKVKIWIMDNIARFV